MKTKFNKINSFGIESKSPEMIELDVDEDKPCESIVSK